MTWNRRYVLKSYIRGALWIVPFFAVVAYLVFVRIAEAVNHWLVLSGRVDETTSFYGLTAAGARPLLETIITLNMSFLVFTFGSLLVAIQVAGGQYTPRIIATTLLRDNAIRFSVGYFVFTLLCAHRVLIRMDGEIVHQFNIFLVAAFGSTSIVVFLYLIDHAARMLRPISLVRRVSENGIAVIESLYPKPTIPQPLGKVRIAPADKPARTRAASDRTVTHAGASGVVLAVNLPGLVAQARRANGIIEFIPQVGDFVAVDEPLFQLYGGASCDRRPYAAGVGRVRVRAHHRTGPDICLSYPGRYRDQGVVSGDQRSDDGSHHHRPAATPASAGRPAGIER